MTKQQQLDDLRQKIIQHNPTPDLAAYATQLVFGDGNIDAGIVLVGEAPGKKEDEQGKPFVGAAGTFLNELLAHISLKRDEVYITNIVKYRPPENRDPLPDEKTAFWPYLLKQLAIIAPKVVVTLGRHSGQAFLPDLHISRDHGTPKRIKVQLNGEERPLIIIPMYHPAAALYNGGLRNTLLDDFLVVRSVLKKITI